MSNIFKFDGDKRELTDLLLVGDEQEDMILRYIHRSDVFVYSENGEILGVCAVTDEGDGICELKNIAVRPDHQRKGIGSEMIGFVQEHCRGRFQKLILGTGDSPLTVPFYEKCGFVRTHTVPNFFTENYDHPIFEGGVQLVDMIYFEKNLEV